MLLISSVDEKHFIMALITQIRKRTGLIISLIALGVLGFILMDIQGNQSIAGGAGGHVGSIDGNKISINEFQSVKESLYGNSGGEDFSRNGYVWDYFVEKIIIGQLAEKIGLGVSREEMKDLAFGENLSPIIQQKFMDPNTRRIDRNQLGEIKKAIEGNSLPDEGRRNWAQVEKEIYKERLQEKFNNLITKSIYTPNWLAEVTNKERNETVDITFVKVPYETVPDSEVKLTDADYEKYLKENKGNYFQNEETRRISYVIFDVVPSAKDSAEAKQKISGIIEKYNKVNNDSLFVNANNGQMVGQFVSKDKLEGVLKDTAFDLAKGGIFGPYIEQGAFMAFKILDRKILADSVRSRHILIQGKSASDLAQANKTIDSLKILVETGRARFDTLATKFGQDATKEKGGDLGYVAPNAMVKEFNDLIFEKADQGKIYKVTTQFGVHLVEVTGKKFVKNEPYIKFSIFREAIIPSEETNNAAEDKANNFLTTNRSVEQMIAATKGSKDIEVLRSVPLKANEYNLGVLGAESASYSIIKWAFTSDAKLGEVSPVLYQTKNKQDFFTDKLIIAGLSGIIPAGMPKLEYIKEDIKPQVIFAKKAEVIKSRFGGKDLNSVATAINGKIDTAKAINFASNFIAGVGNEPKVLAAAFKLQTNAISAPIGGNSAAFIISPIGKSSAGTSADILTVKNGIRDQMKAQIAPKIMDSLKKEVKIKDNRYDFFN